MTKLHAYYLISWVLVQRGQATYEHLGVNKHHPKETGRRVELLSGNLSSGHSKVSSYNQNLSPLRQNHRFFSKNEITIL